MSDSGNGGREQVFAELGALAVAAERGRQGEGHADERQVSQRAGSILAAITEQVSDSFIVTDADFKVAYANRAFCRLFGYSVEEVRGKTPGLFNAEPASAQIQTEIYRTVRSGGEWRGVLENIRKDGSVFPCELSVSSIIDQSGQTLAHVGIQRDISERVEAEQALARKVTQLSSFLNNIPDMAWLKDADSRFIAANRAFGAATGVDPDVLIDHTCAVCFGEEAAATHRADDLKVMQGKTQVRFEEKIVDPSGSEVWLETIKSPILNDSDEVVGTVGIARDITERKLAKEQAVRLEEQLRHDQKMKAIGKLAGGVAHDMNNMLAAIMGLASAMQQDTDSDDPRQEDVAGILAACEKGHDLTRNLLGFAREGKYRRESLCLNQCIGEVRKLLMRTIPKGVAFRTDLAPELPLVEGDSGQINQVLVNLAINAVDAMRGAGGLTFATRQVHLEDPDPSGPPALPPGSYVRIQVSDSGAGMSAETRGRAFEPFFTTKPTGEGTGLGLSMVYGTVENHRGAVLLDSDEGQGTVVTIYLPALEGGVAQDPSDPGSEPAIGQGSGTVLLVDDEDVVRASAKRILERLGYQVVVAQGGQAALDIYRAKRDEIDLVILDLIMPEMGGEETFHKFKQIDPDVRILASSGHIEEATREQLVARGAAEFVQKPYTLKQLAEAVARMLA